MKTLQLFAITALAMSLLGCSRSKPTEAEAREGISQMVARDSNNLMKLQSFVKTNGIGDEDRGYTLEFTGVALLQEDCVFGGHMGESLFAAMKGLPQTPLEEMAVFGKGRGKKGQTLKFHGEIRYGMTERGWRVSDVNCYAN